GVIKMTNDKQAELDYLKTVKRQDIQEKINKAQQFFDVNVDASNKDIIDEQYRVEEQIKALELKLAQSEHLKESDYTLLNHTLTIKWLADEFEASYKLVSPVDQDIDNNYISIESPLGKVLVDGQVGDVLKVNLPNGEEKVEIINVNS